jgi:quercetin dioxygenase-like cupin family protein
MAGQTYELGPMTLAFKPCEAEVDGVYSMIESIEPPGASVDLHRHPSWQETFLVLDGRFDFNVAGLLASQPEQAPSARQRVEIRP